MNGMINVAVESTQTMASGTFRLKSRELMDKYGRGKTLYRIAKDADTNYSTFHYLIDDNKRGIQVDTLFSFLSGMGLSLEQIQTLPLGEVFEFSPEEYAA